MILCLYSFGHMREMANSDSQNCDNDRRNSELQTQNFNLNSLCEHIHMIGFQSGAFSDIVVHAMGSTYLLHRLILSRSSYFRNMLHGPWKEADAQTVTLHVDDNNVNDEAITIALAYIYGHYPNLSGTSAFRVLAVASFLDLQDLCVLCTDFIISELRSTNFLAYQVFAESQDYGIHGERVRNACWGYLCQCSFMELKEVLPKLSSQTLYALFSSDELWVPDEEHRFDLALFSFYSKADFCKRKEGLLVSSSLEIGVGCRHIAEPSTEHVNPCDVLDEPIDFVVDFNVSVSDTQRHTRSDSCAASLLDTSVSGSNCNGPRGRSVGDDLCFDMNVCNWPEGDDTRQCSAFNTSSDDMVSKDWVRCGLPPLSWGGRIVDKMQLKSSGSDKCGSYGKEHSAFFNIFEGGSLLYCNMSFEVLLYARKRLEELGFPCKAVNDGLWLQTLLRQRVQELGSSTCRDCHVPSVVCVCRPSFGLSRGGTVTGCCVQEQEHTNVPGGAGNMYVTGSSFTEGNGFVRPVRMHARGHVVDGLAGIGRGPTHVSTSVWPPTRFVFSRIPSSRNLHHSASNDGFSDQRPEHPSADPNVATGRPGGPSEDSETHTVGSSVSGPSPGALRIPLLPTPQQALRIEWESMSNSIALDLKTPLIDFPPFRFGVEFEGVQRLLSGHVKHSSEVFYAGSMWKVSIQAFSDEDPQGRRTLGLFLHRRKAELMDYQTKVHMFVDHREKITARYQLICPSKREVMVFGSFKQTGTLLPKAPKGWGWRTALLFDELSDFLQSGSLRIVAVVQLV